jgi:hypothetical protein
MKRDIVVILIVVLLVAIKTTEIKVSVIKPTDAIKCRNGLTDKWMSSALWLGLYLGDNFLACRPTN